MEGKWRRKTAGARVLCAAPVPVSQSREWSQIEKHSLAKQPGGGVRINPAAGWAGSMPCQGALAGQRLWGTTEVSHEPQLLRRRKRQWLHPSAQQGQLGWSSARKSFVLREGSAPGCSFSKKGLCLLPTNISHSIPSTQPALPLASLKPSWTPAQGNSPHFL